MAFSWNLVLITALIDLYLIFKSLTDSIFISIHDTRYYKGGYQDNIRTISGQYQDNTRILQGCYKGNSSAGYMRNHYGDIITDQQELIAKQVR